MKFVLFFVVTILGVCVLSTPAPQENSKGFYYSDFHRLSQTFGSKAGNDDDKYFFYPFEGVPFHKAIAICGAFGMKLLSIDDEKENFEIQYKFRKDASLDDTFWIGGSSLGDTSYYWVNNGAPFSYTNWNTGEPNNVGNMENCATIAAGTDLRWNDIDCNTNLRFICERL